MIARIFALKGFKTSRAPRAVDKVWSVPRSAGFQPAVSQRFQPAIAPNLLRIQDWRHSADWKSAIQQAGSLPYRDFITRPGRAPGRCAHGKLLLCGLLLLAGCAPGVERLRLVSKPN